MKRSTRIQAAAINVAVALLGITAAPVQANENFSKREEKVFAEAFEAGFESGVMAASCAYYALGKISRNDLASTAKRALREPQWVKDKLINAFQDQSNAVNATCGPVVLPIWGAQPQPASHSLPISFNTKDQ